MLKLFVDDIRNAPDDTWILERTITGAIRKLSMMQFDVVSLDHDISLAVKVGLIYRPFPCDETYEPVARYLALMPEDTKPKSIILHTANPPAAEKMAYILRHAGFDDIKIQLSKPAFRNKK